MHAKARDSTDNLILMGAIHYHLGQFQESVHCNYLCILLDASAAEAYANLANSLQHVGHLTVAVHYYQARFLSLLSPCALQQREMSRNTPQQVADTPTARTEPQQWRDTGAGASRLHHCLGLLWFGLVFSCAQRAAQCVQAALRLRPDFDDARNNLASVYTQLGDVQAAVRQYAAALRSNPRLLHVLHNLGDLLLSQVRLPPPLHLLLSQMRLPTHITCCSRRCGSPTSPPIFLCVASACLSVWLQGKGALFCVSFHHTRALPRHDVRAAPVCQYWPLAKLYRCCGIRRTLPPAARVKPRGAACRLRLECAIERFNMCRKTSDAVCLAVWWPCPFIVERGAACRGRRPCHRRGTASRRHCGKSRAARKRGAASGTCSAKWATTRPPSRSTPR